MDFRDLASRVQLTISGIWKERDKWDTLDVLVVKGRCTEEEVLDGNRLVSIVSMLIGLIKANSDYRLHEGTFGQGD